VVGLKGCANRKGGLVHTLLVLAGMRHAAVAANQGGDPRQVVGGQQLRSGLGCLKQWVIPACMQRECSSRVGKCQDAVLLIGNVECVGAGREWWTHVAHAT
jgi:hypothetical protein